MLKYHYRRLARSEEGVSIIEFAFVAPILIFMLMGIIEYSLVMFGGAVLEGSVNNAAREGSTGYVNDTQSGLCPPPNGAATQTQNQYINCLIQTRVAPLLDPAKLQITSTDLGASFGSVTGISYNTTTCTNSTPTPGGPPACAETPSQNGGDIIVYTAQYPWQIVTPILQNVLGTNGTYTLLSSAVVKNEPYPTGR